MRTPVTVASGTFGLEYLDYFDSACLGAIVTKTITRQPKAGNNPPRLWETEAGLLNSIGLQNPGVELFIRDNLPEWTALNVPVIVSFSGSTIAEFSEMLDILEKADGIAGYEVNISCPNVANEGLAFGVDAGVVEELTCELSNKTERELIVKLSPNVTRIDEIAKAAQVGGADSLSLINTLLGMAIDWRTGRSRIARGVAGYSGVAVKPVALRCVYEVARNVSIPILSIGGICTWQDALEFFYAGASAVSVGTHLFREPEAPAKMVQGLQQFCQKNNCNLEAIIGNVNGID
ncbi:MAG: dihydroorotate dehydrogenase [Candidatus Cloacimonetes bacterium]|nr:dihydroorotate dehydrogenase [Candidatus Cloacimonadota bacterium]